MLMCVQSYCYVVSVLALFFCWYILSVRLQNLNKKIKIIKMLNFFKRPYKYLLARLHWQTSDTSQWHPAWVLINSLIPTQTQLDKNDNVGWSSFSPNYLQTHDITTASNSFRDKMGISVCTHCNFKTRREQNIWPSGGLNGPSSTARVTNSGNT